ncbi:putative membrane protein [Paenibacillus riograndensis SBR5]|uniref:Putative membrane protein n=1 Tax=Paenibacillus riograndensis SBR5 TaxID=1073571 RepID=A0A0E4H9F8_9BACL|nr:putative membrane protein [Paenibacillus riograndensis SBR5]
MNTKRVAITFNILAIIFFLLTLLGEKTFEYAPLIGWIGGVPH